jgi:hypothetical protein
LTHRAMWQPALHPVLTWKGKSSCFLGL